MHQNEGEHLHKCIQQQSSSDIQLVFINLWYNNSRESLTKCFTMTYLGLYSSSVTQHSGSFEVLLFDSHFPVQVTANQW